MGCTESKPSADPSAGYNSRDGPGPPPAGTKEAAAVPKPQEPRPTAPEAPDDMEAADVFALLKQLQLWAERYESTNWKEAFELTKKNGEKIASAFASAGKLLSTNAETGPQAGLVSIFLNMDLDCVQGLLRVASHSFKMWVQLKDYLSTMHCKGDAELAAALFLEGVYGAQGMAKLMQALELSQSTGQEQLACTCIYWKAAVTGSPQEAEPLWRLVMAGRQRLVGDHARTFDAMNMLGVCLRKQGRYKEAEQMIRDAHAGRVRLYGEQHPCTFETQNNLAVGLEARGDVETAALLHERLLDERKKVLGPQHMDTLDTMSNLATCRVKQGRMEQAIGLLQSVLHGRKALQGPEDVHTLKAMSNLAFALELDGHDSHAAEILELRKTVVSTRLRVLGPKHQDSLDAVQRFADALLVQGKLSEATAMYRALVNGQTQVFGKDHPLTKRAMETLETCATKCG